MIEQLWGGLCMRWSEAQFRLSTDSMLLADFCRLTPQSAVCDLGCGCGSISLLLCGNTRSCASPAWSFSRRPPRWRRKTPRRTALTDAFP